MKSLKALLLASVLLASFAHAEKVTIAAASDLKFALNEVVAAFKAANAGAEVGVVYGSSGQFNTQIQQGGPYDIFFSADITYPQEIVKAGMAASEVKRYAVGRIVLWSATLDATKLTVESLADPNITHIAIANPQHAPYGKRAEEALRKAGVWDKVQGKLVLGENISQTAQFVQSGNVEVGIIALSLAVNPELSRLGGYSLIPDSMHGPLEQGFVITQRAAGNAMAKRFADYMDTDAVHKIMRQYGFALPQSVAK